MDYNNLAGSEVVKRTEEGLRRKGYEVMVVSSGKEALVKIRELIPQGKSVMNGSSTTLKQIGYFEYLESGEHGWEDLHAKITAEDDKAKRDKLRKESVLSDYYLGSVHGLAETGEFVIASNTGSQLPHVVFTSANLIFVVSTKKIVPTVPDTYGRLTSHVFPLEDKRMKEQGAEGSNMNKVLLFNGEVKEIARKITFILVEEDLGF